MEHGCFIIFNDRRKDHFISVIYNIEGEEAYELPIPIYTLSHNGRYALTLNFSQLAMTRPGYGYVGVSHPRTCEKAPIDDVFTGWI